MSDYMFMLESHLNPDQQRALQVVQQAAADAHLALYLTGGAMRDMLGGFPIRDLDFTVEGDAAALAKTVVKAAKAELLHADEARRRVELLFPGDVTVELRMARREQFLKPGGKPAVEPATIHDDLRTRDFTINAIALSLSRASRGLLIDPVNGRSDLEVRELRAVSNYGFHDDPTRLLRLWRYQARLGFSVAERTQRQYENAREAGAESHISARALAAELRRAAEEANPGEVLRRWDEKGLLKLVSPVLVGEHWNPAGFAKLAKAKSQVPFGVTLHTHPLTLFLSILTEHLPPKDKQAVVSRANVTPEELDRWQKLPLRAKGLEKRLLSPSLLRPSLLYQTLVSAPGEQILHLMLHSGQRLVQDRIRNYLQKYFMAAQEVTDEDVLRIGITRESPQFKKKKDELVATRLNSRPKRPVQQEELTAGVAVGRRT